MCPHPSLHTLCLSGLACALSKLREERETLCGGVDSVCTQLSSFTHSLAERASELSGSAKAQPHKLKLSVRVRRPQQQQQQLFIFAEDLCFEEKVWFFSMNFYAECRRCDIESEAMNKTGAMTVVVLLQLSATKWMNFSQCLCNHILYHHLLLQLLNSSTSNHIISQFLAAQLLVAHSLWYSRLK